MLLLALFASPLPVNMVSADDTYTVPAASLDKSVYMARWLNVYEKNGIERLKADAAALFILSWYESHVTTRISSMEFTEALAKFEKEYEKKLAGYDATYDYSNRFYEDFLAALKIFSSLGSRYSPLVTAAERTATLGFDWQDTIRRGAAYETTSNEFALLSRIEKYLLNQVYINAPHDSTLGGLWDMRFLVPLGVSITNSHARDIVAKNPTIMPRIINQKIINSVDGSITVSIGEMREEFEEQFEIVRDSMVSIRGYLVEIDDHQHDILEWIAQTELRRIVEADAKAKAAAFKLKLDAASSGMFIISTIVGLKDPQLATQMSVIGNTAIQLAGSFNGYLEAMAKLGKAGDNLGMALSSTILAGNILGAAMTMISLFSDSGPSIDETLLNNLIALRQEVSELRVQMNDRFDRLDRKLDAIFLLINDRFDDIDYQNRKLNRRIDQIQADLLRIQTELARFQNTTEAYLKEMYEQELYFAIDEALGYKERTGIDLEYKDYSHYEKLFNWWATSPKGSFGENEAGPINRDYRDEYVWQEIGNKPLEKNVNYLSGWLSYQGVDTFSLNRLPNYRTWALASGAFARLAMEWPEYAAQIHPSELTAVVQVGEDYQTAIQRIASDNRIFDALIENYRWQFSGSSSLYMTIWDIENEYMAEQKLTEQSIDIWGGPYQRPSFVPPSLQILARCDGFTGLIAAPNGQANYIPPPFLLSADLGLSNPHLCYSVKEINIELACKLPVYCGYYAHLKVELTLKLEEEDIFTTYIISSSKYFFWPGRPEYPSAYARALQNWEQGENFKGVFENRLTDPPCNSMCPLRSEIAGPVQTRLYDYQRDLYSLIASEFSRMGQLQKHAEEFAGATALLNAFIAVGLPRALEADDYLRSLLFGTERILDRDSVYAAYVNVVPSNVNIRYILLATLDERVNALDSVLKAYVEQIRQGTHIESQPAVSSTLLVLDLSRVMASASKPKIYLPIIAKSLP